jgi:hypothetical protein
MPIDENRYFVLAHRLASRVDVVDQGLESVPVIACNVTRTFAHRVRMHGTDQLNVGLVVNHSHIVSPEQHAWMHVVEAHVYYIA